MKILISIFCILISTNIIANSSINSSKEIWLQYKEINNCQPGHCLENVPSIPLKKALSFYKENPYTFENTKYIGIIDFSLNSTKKRLFIINLSTGTSESFLVTHGKKSETEKSIAGQFSNTIGSEQSSLGFYRTGRNTYEGAHGTSLKLYGLSETNSNAFERGIVIHAADYATEDFVNERGRLGLSQGCPAVSPDNIDVVIKRLKGKSLLYIYSNELGF